MQEENLWEKYNPKPKPKPQAENLWAKYNQPEKEEEEEIGSVLGVGYTASEEQRYADEAKVIGNRIKNISQLIGNAVGIMQGKPALIAPFIEGQKQSVEGNQLVRRDIANMFSQADMKSTIKNMWEGGIERIRTKKMETLGALFDMPSTLVESLVGDTFSAITGVDLSGSEIKALEPEEYARRTKVFIGNAVAAAVAPAVSKLVEASFAIPARQALGAGLTESNIAAAPLANQAALGTITPKLGKLGRAIVDDVTAGAAAGMAQGAIANANTPETYAAAAAGLLFAPIGVVTGWYRGTKGTGALEDAITQAKDISLIRQWQELGDANVESAAKKVEALMESDQIADAIGKDLYENDLTVSDDLWNDFKGRLTEDESFASSLVRYAEEKNLTPHLNEMLEKFATKYVEENVDKAEVAHLRQLIKDNRAVEDGKFMPKTHGDVIDAAVKRGFFVTNEFGKLKIRDIESGETIGTANTSAEAVAIMNETGKPANPVNMNAGAKFADGVEMPQDVTPGVTPHLADDFEPVTNNAQKAVTAFDIGRMKNLTSMNAFIEAIDLHFGTNLKHSVFEPLELSHRNTNVAINNDLKSGRVQLIDALARRMQPEELEKVGMAMESQTFDEIMTPDGYTKGFTVSPKAAALARFAQDNNIDLTKVLYYRRAQSAVRYYYNNQAEANAHEQMKLNKQVGMTTEEAAKIYDQSLAGVDQNPDYLEATNKLIQTFQPDQNFIKAAEMIEDLYKSEDGSANTAAAVRLKLALEHPDTHGLSRNDFIAKHLDGKQTQLLEKLEEAYAHFGGKDKFNIPDARMINRYMNHYRQFGDILDSYVIGDFERGIMDGAMRQFVSAMIRTGEVAHYSMNPVLNLTSYIRGGNKSQIVYRALEDILNKTDALVGKELAKVNDPVVHNMLRRRLNDYQRDITGQHSIGDTETMHIAAKMWSNMVMSDGRRLTTQEIISRMQSADMTDTMLNLSTSGLIGGVPAQGLRDVWDVGQKFYVKYGPKRMWDLLTTKVDARVRDALVESGEITKPEAVDIYNVTHTQGTEGTINRATRHIADLGFKASLQMHFYMRNQAAVYIHAMEHTGKVLRDLNVGKITREQAYKAVDLNRFDVATQRMFDAYVRDGMHESAARMLAKQDVREIVGTFTRGNQAPILNSKMGKLWGQLGSWGMTNRSVLQNLLTRGTKADIATAGVRYATTIAVTGAVGRAMGVNLGRWMLLPTSVIFTGGPLVEMTQALGSEAASELGGSGQQTHFTRNAISRSLQQFIPGSMAFKNVKKAVELQTQGTGFGPARTAGQAIGIQANTQPFKVGEFEVDTHRNFMDYVIGNYPIKWNK